MGNFKDLKVWQRGIEVGRDVYVATRTFPREELFGLTSQARRAAISVTSNVAEASGRHGRPDQVRFYRIALGSALELESLLIVSTELEMLSASDRDRLCEPVKEVQRMLNALIRYNMRAKDQGPRTMT